MMLFWLRDIFILSVFIILIVPILFLLSCIVCLFIGCPIIFKQKRPGLNGKTFNFFKFRTMTNVRDGHGNLLDDNERITRFGKFLRKTSLDELPSFWNVLKGDMSLVGPRPLLMEYLPLYSKEQMRRHEVKPGITGWAQINGRNAISWEEKFELDIWYVKNQSFRLDLRILLLTIWKVLKREGITHGSGETMPKYKGTKNG
jgi:sugar transferase EpsL